jgi:hypothetical protein
MPRIRESITPPQAGNVASYATGGSGIEGGTPAASAPIPAATEAEGMMGPPASQGPTDILTGNRQQTLDPGPPESPRAVIASSPGPRGGDQSLAEELVIYGYPPEGGEEESCGYLPFGSEEQEPRSERGDQATASPTTPGAGPSAAPEPNVSSGPKGDSRPPPGAYIVHGQTDSERDRGRRAFIYRGFGAKP